MTALDMFGLVGGYLGLFVGVSLATIIEFAEFGIDWIFKMIFRKKEGVNGQTVLPKDQAKDQPTDLLVTNRTPSTTGNPLYASAT